MTTLLSLFLFWPLSAWALGPGDGIVVHFKDGASLSGVLVRLTGEKVEMEAGGARLTWGLDAVSRLELRRTDVQEFLELEKAVTHDQSRIPQLARFARWKGLHTYYNRLAERLDLPCENALSPQPAQAPYENRDQAQPGWENPQNQPPAMGFGAGGPEVHGVPQPSPGYNAPPVFFIPVPVSAPRAITKEEREEFLRGQEARREALRHRPTTPLEIFQFRLQEALDRHAHGLAFASEPF